MGIINELRTALELRYTGVVHIRHEKPEGGLLKTCGPLPPVAPEPATALKDQVGGRQISDHEVKIKIKGLLDYLRRHDHRPVGPVHTVPAKPRQDFFLTPQSL